MPVDNNSPITKHRYTQPKITIYFKHFNIFSPQGARIFVADRALGLLAPHFLDNWAK